MTEMFKIEKEPLIGSETDIRKDDGYHPKQKCYGPWHYLRAQIQARDDLDTEMTRDQVVKIKTVADFAYSCDRPERERARQEMILPDHDTDQT